MLTCCREISYINFNLSGNVDEEGLLENHKSLINEIGIIKLKLKEKVILKYHISFKLYEITIQISLQPNSLISLNSDEKTCILYKLDENLNMEDMTRQ